MKVAIGRYLSKHVRAIPEWLVMLLIILAVIVFFLGCAMTGIDPGALLLAMLRWIMVAVVVASVGALALYVIAFLFGRRR